RHTRLVSDWSSDVCSSDLGDAIARNSLRKQVALRQHRAHRVELEIPEKAAEPRGAAIEVQVVAKARECGGVLDPGLLRIDLPGRSEERRVGKQGRARGSRE